jgi:replicative DNA helicase
MSLENSLRKAFPEEQPTIEPHNVELEQALLGAILVNNEAYYRVSDFLEPGHFFEPVHQALYEAATSLIKAGRVASPISMLTFLPATEKIGDKLTPSQYLARLAAEATVVLNCESYGLAIKDLHDRRLLMQLGEEMVVSSLSDPIANPTPKILDDMEQRLVGISSADAGGEGFMHFEQAMMASIDMASLAFQRDGGLSGVSTGLSDLDYKMGGLQRSDLVIVAGRPGMGKTALACNIAYHVASAYRGEPKPNGTIETVSGGIVGFFSLEMSAEQLATRIAAEIVEIPSSRIRRGEISEAEFTKLAEAANTLRRLPLYIEQAGGLSIAQVTTRARRLKRQRGLDLLIVDYLQLMRGSNRRDGNRVTEVAEITTGLKALAKELNVPIIALSQLSRQVEAREDKRPMLADLRESGSIEQDADVVIFVYREEYYLNKREPRAETEEWMKWETALKLCEGCAELIIGKQRHGPEGTVKVAFDARYTRFSNLAREDRLPQRTGSTPSFKERGVE